VAYGALLGLVLFGCLTLAAQGCATNSSVIACKLDALKILPEDPRMVTPFDAIDLVKRLNECRKPPADAGAP
jgi:hypothetical protein